MPRLRLRRFCIPGGFFLFASIACGQEVRGRIFGQVSDPAAAAVAGAQVHVRNIDTNVTLQIVTNESGYYDAPLLVAGRYRVLVEASGFKKTEQPNVELQQGSRVEVNFKLEVGAVTDSVIVSVEAPMVNTDSLTSGTVVASKSVLNLPWPGGNSVVLAMLTAGVQSTDTISDFSVRLHSGGPGLRSTAYGNVGGNEYSVDGMSTNANSRTNGFNPAPELVEAVKISTSAFDADQGHSTGITIALQTRSGTNDFHGTLRHQHHQYAWDALDFFAKQAYYRRIAEARAAGNQALADDIASKPARSPGRENQYAGSFGGPVVIPKLLNGRNKLFFFVGYAGFRVGEYRGAFNAVPTAEMRRGDFSSLQKIVSATGVSQASVYQIFDPYSVRPDPARAGHVIRTALPGNIVPQSRIVNPMYEFMSEYLPLPNVAPNDTVEPNRNLDANSAIYTEHYTQIANRFDYNASATDRFFFRWSWNDWKNHTGNFQNYLTPNFRKGAGGNRHNTSFGMNWVHNFGARTLLDVTVGSNQYRDEGISPAIAGYPPSYFGLPGYLDPRATDAAVLPSVSFTGWSGFSGGGGSVSRYRVLSGKADLSILASRHTVKLGVDARGQYFTGGTPGALAGSYGYTSTFTQQTDDALANAGTGAYGGSWATFMMGLPTAISTPTNATAAYLNPYYAAYVQDAWRATDRLTLNFGLRMEYELGPTDRYNRLIGYFDPTVSLPITAGALAAYAASPIPELPASQFAVLGGATFPGANSVSRRLWSNALNWLPRFSAAYRLNSTTVIRAGTGLYYDTLNVQNETLNQLGYSWTTNTQITNDFGQTWLVGNPTAGVPVVADPFPVRADGTRFDDPPGSRLGPMAPVGRGYTFVPFDRDHARQVRWRLDVQRQFGAAMVINVGYSGSYSDAIPMSRTLSTLPSQFYWYSSVRNDAVANNLNANVPNPYHIRNFAALQQSNPLLYNYMATNSFFTANTIRKSALLSPYSHLNGLTQTTAVGKAKTQQIDVSFERRFAAGFNANVAYTRLINWAANYFPNPFDLSPAWQPSNNGKPHRITSSFVAELPFGKGRRWLQSGIGSKLAGGFQLSMIQEYQPGALITWGATTYYSGTDYSKLCSGGQHIIGQWFDTSGFQTNASLVAANAGQARVFPNIIDAYRGCRGDSLKRANASLVREFRIRERMNLQLRGDVYNITNHSQMGLPNTNPTSTDFGRITSTVNGGGGGPTTNRSLQVAARLNF